MESFEVVTDHMVLLWLISPQKPQGASREVDRGDANVSVQLNVRHEKGDGELNRPPRRVESDIVLVRGVTLCNLCLNGFEEVEEIVELEAIGNEGDAIIWAGVARTLISVQAKRPEQRKEYGAHDFSGNALWEEYFQDEDSI
jgi:hypothetical protein